MTWEEIYEELDIAPIWYHWYLTQLALNANIVDSPGYYPVSRHPLHLKTITEFKVYRLNTSAEDNKLLHKHWKQIHNL